MILRDAERIQVSPLEMNFPRTQINLTNQQRRELTNWKQTKMMKRLGTARGLVTDQNEMGRYKNYVVVCVGGGGIVRVYIALECFV